MKIIKGYKTELDLNTAQITACLKHAGCARFAYNWGLRRYQEEYAAGRKTPTAIGLHKELNARKPTDFPWMYEVSKCAPQEALRDLEKAGRWYVSVQMEEEVADPLPATGKALGVDLGVKILATTSEAVAYENPEALRSNLKKLARLGRRHSRKVKGSKNRTKSARKLSQMHARIAHIRENALHQATSAIAKTKPRTIVLENLNVQGMMQNRKMSRAVSDVGMYEFKRQLTYKAERLGISILTVSRWFPSSRTCSCCGWVDKDQELDDRVFVCMDCGYVADRDYNAAKNLASSA